MDNFLPSELIARLKETGDVEIVAGIPSYNNARTIGQVVRAVAAGLGKYFPECKAIIVNSDGGSKDGTHEAVLNAEVDHSALFQVTHPVNPVRRITTAYAGIPGKGSAFRAIFAVAKHLNAKACVVVDSDLRSITPQWVELLVRPVVDREFDFIAPYYLRHKYDGTITNSIIYPMTRAMFGQQVRQPIGGDFGISGKLAARYLEKDVWETDVARFGVDIWMTLTAIAEGFRVGQSYLGAKLHDAKDPGADLTSMFRQVVGSLFGLMETYEKTWQSVAGSKAVPMFGFPFDVGLEPIPVNVERMEHAFTQGTRDLREIYVEFLSPGTLAALAECARAGDGVTFRLPDKLWVHTVYEFAAAYHRRAIDRDHLMQSLVPLYLGRTASFVLEVQESTALEVEERIEKLCEVFEAEKGYLAALWRAGAGKEKTHAGTV
ncbi:MAG TPA: cell wall biosynthesis glycosyltransferase [Candidatus Acidoferrales bacterium]|nr:cell wall biosynthesis glycosyltransferase [Candidatus Acidoferrales bacterium]